MVQRGQSCAKTKRWRKYERKDNKDEEKDSRTREFKNACQTFDYCTLFSCFSVMMAYDLRGAGKASKKKGEEIAMEREIFANTNNIIWWYQEDMRKCMD